MSFKNDDPDQTPEKRDSMWGRVVKTEIDGGESLSATEESEPVALKNGEI